MTTATAWKYVGRDKQKSIDELRPTLLEKLRAMTVTGELKNPIVVTYSGYGDSGDIEEKPDNLPEEAEDFIWDILTVHEGGFENNDGGRGEIHWDLIEDKITIDHTEYFTESKERSYVI